MHSEVGKIKSIAVRNFLTYDELKFVPGKYLNVIIGPNGTGKSSIVAAIILGCGGKPSILSRSKDISDYVKNGKVKADIGIELIINDAGDTTVLKRSFDRSNKEIFRVDEEKVSQKAYIDLVKNKYNIHVDNLCMFLPQDRVQDFTKLNPQDLLYNTQTSVCSQDIIDTFESLKKMRETQKDLVKNHADIEIQLEDHINRNNQLHSMIENSKLKDKLVKEMELYQKKLAWLEFDKIKAKYDEAADDIKKLQESIESKKSVLKPLEKRQSEISGTKEALKSSISKSDALMNQAIQDIDKLLEASYKFESDIGQARQNFRNIVATSKTHEKDIKDLELVVLLDKDEYNEAQRELRNEGNFEDMMKQYDQQLKSNKKKIEGMIMKLEKLQKALDENIIPDMNNSKRKIACISDIQNQKFKILQSHYEDSFKAFEWLNQNRNQFRGHIYNPIITEITVTEKKYAKYVENVISNRDLETFLCTNKDDMRELIHKLRNEMKLQVNVAYTEQVGHLKYKSELEIDGRLKHMGIFAYVLDIIDGPIPVLNYLCSLYQIHNTAIGDDRTYQCASQLPDKISVFFSTNHRFSVNISSYTGKKNTSCNEIYAKNILNISIDQEQLEHEKKYLINLEKKAEDFKAQKVPLQKEIQQIEGLQTDIRNKKSALTAKIKNIKTIENKMKKREAELENLKNHKINIKDERKKSKDNVDKIVKNLLTNNMNVYKTLEKYKENFVKNILSKKKMQLFDDSTGNVDEQIDKLKSDLKKVEETLRRANSVCESLVTQLNGKREAALKLTDNKAPHDARFKYVADFKKIPDTIECIQDKIYEMQGRIDCIRGVDPRILSEYEERKKMIEELQYQIKSEMERTAQLENKLQELHNKWYPEIQRVVDTINENFSDFFAKMGFVGEVELIRKEERDYNDYGIQIRVQYRDNEKLQALNRHVQSGGERAVAIAIYTLSLQHLTVVPFRCVDEINQGMDPKNERKIFQMLVDITCREGESQYFFVTPKLLPNLPYSDLMTVSVVHNGKHIDHPFVFMNGEASDGDE